MITGRLPRGAVNDQIRAAQQPLAMDIGDSPFTAQGWRIVGDDVYTCVPPPGYEIDRWILARIHAFDRSVMPIWRQQMYLPPNSNEPVVVTHHGLAHYVLHPKRHLTLFNVRMPQPQQHRTPNELILIWEKFDKQMMHEGGPGGFMRFDAELLSYLRKDYLRSNVSIAKVMEEDERKLKERKARAKANAAVEEEYRSREFNKLVARVQETATEHDFMAYQAKVEAKARARRT